MASYLDRVAVLANRASTMSNTARRYAELNGGSDQPEGEVWDHIAELSAMIFQLAALLLEGASNA